MKTIISKILNIKFRRKKFLTERYQIDYIIYIVYISLQFLFIRILHLSFYNKNKDGRDNTIKKRIVGFILMIIQNKKNKKAFI